MNIIFKYVFVINRESANQTDSIYIHKNALIRKIGMQGEKLCFWCEVAENVTDVDLRKFVVYGTGRNIRNNLHYIDTVFDGEYVWHVFEELPK